MHKECRKNNPAITRLTFQKSSTNLAVKRAFQSLIDDGKGGIRTYKHHKLASTIDPT